MEFRKAIDLLDKLSGFPLKALENRPRICIYDSQSEGYNLIIKANVISTEYRSFIEKIAESRKLEIRESNGCITIYGS